MIEKSMNKIKISINKDVENLFYVIGSNFILEFHEFWMMASAILFRFSLGDTVKVSVNIILEVVGTQRRSPKRTTKIQSH